MNVYQWIIIMTIGIFFWFQGIYFIYTNYYINENFNKEDEISKKIYRNLQLIRANLFTVSILIVLIVIKRIIGG